MWRVLFAGSLAEGVLAFAAPVKFPLFSLLLVSVLLQLQLVACVQGKCLACAPPPCRASGSLKRCPDGSGYLNDFVENRWLAVSDPIGVGLEEGYGGGMSILGMGDWLRDQ